MHGGDRARSRPYDESITGAADPRSTRLRAGGAWVSALLALTALAGGCGGSSKAAQPSSRLIVVSSNRTGRDQIWLLDADSSREVRLTHGASNDDYPAFSPNGRQIAWVRVINRHSDEAQIWMMNADGTDPHQVAGEASASSTVAWTPDGRHIIYASGDQGIDGFETANVDGGHAIHLGAALTATEGIDPAWSPNGRQLAFEQDDGSGWGPYIADAKGLRARRVSGVPQDAYAIAWSPDGKTLAMVIENGGTPGIYVVSPQGGPGRFVYRGRIDDGVAWTPDGTHIVFSSAGGEGSQLETVSENGGHAHPYLGTLGYFDMPDWQPRPAPVRIGPVTGEIAYDTDGSVWEMHPDGNDQTQLTSPPHGTTDHDPVWSPDDRSIAFVRTMSHGNVAVWSEVWTMRADGTDQRRLSHEPGYDLRPSWAGTHAVVYYDSDPSVHSDRVREAQPGKPARTVVNQGFFAKAAPDGQLLAYAAPGPQKRIDVYVSNLDGTQPEAVAGGPLIVYEIAWSPDSSHVAFTAGTRTGKTGIYVTSVQQSSFVQLTPANARALSPTWSPDGSTIAYARPGPGKHLLLICERPSAGGPERIVARVPALGLSAPRLQWLTDGSLGFTVPEASGEEFHEVTQAGKVGPDLLQTQGLADNPDWQPLPATPSGATA